MASMESRFVLVIGGSGFIGRHLIAKLSQAAYRIIVPTRRLSHAHSLFLLPGVDDVIEADVYDEAVLHRLLPGIDAVVNLVGVLHSASGDPYGPEFAQAHVDLPRKIVAACVAQGVPRYVHMSALGADAHGPSMYLRSKAAGETMAWAHPALHTTVFRPSVVFGEEDHFLNLFASMQSYLPMIPLACADAKFQPIYVQDVAHALLHALDNDHTIGQTYELGGPTVYTLRELVALAGIYSGHPRPILALSPAWGRLQAYCLEHLPGSPLLSRDNLDSMKIDNVLTQPISPDLAIAPVSLEAVAPAYLAKRFARKGVWRP